ncbi:MAG: hypothetical protein ABJL67_03755 [Sulfitobacter sp.]
MTRSGSISSIYRMGQAETPAPEAQRQQAEQAKRDAWHKHGLLMINPQDVNDDWERQFLINTAEKNYGKRVGRWAKKND